MHKVLVAPTTLAGSEGPHVQLLQQEGFDLTYPDSRYQLTEHDLLKELPGVSAVIAGSEPYTRRVIETAGTLRIIARAGVGFDAVDLAAATERGIVVTITPGANNDAVAEHTLAVILALAKNVIRQHGDLKQGIWKREPTLSLRGKTLGIIGLGRIGKAVASRAVAFKMRCLAYEPCPDLVFVERHNIHLAPLDQVLTEADFVTLHLPLTAESKYLMNRRTLALMKPSAFLINTARGGLVCEADLLEALRSRRIAGAALDVFEQEPAWENALFGLDNVLLTPHSAGVDTQSLTDMALLAARAVTRLRRGEWPGELIVNAEVRERFFARSW